MPSEQSPWVVKGVPEYIRRKVKIYAVQRGITMAQAVEEIINAVMPGEEREVFSNPFGRPSYPSPQANPTLPTIPMASVDMQRWLQLWLKGEIPESPPPLFSIGSDTTHEYAQRLMMDKSGQHLPEAIMQDLDRHLRTCEECQQFARDLLRE